MGWNGSESRNAAPVSQKAARKSPPSKGRGLVALVIVALGGAFAIWFFGGRGKPAPAGGEGNRRPTKIAEVKPQIATNKVVEAVAVTPTNRNVRMERGVEVVSCTARTNQSGVVVEKLKLADGRLIEKVVMPKPVFRHASDQLIAMAVSAKPGQSMPPMPSLGNIDEEFAKSLLDPIRIEEGDSEKVKEMKLAVKEARAYLAAEVKNGRTVAECLQEHCAQMEKIADRHTMAVQQMQEMRKEGASAEEIGEFRKRINEVFREQGIPELPTGKKKAEEENKE